MRYPGDQQPHRQPYLPPDPPRRGTAPPFGDGADAAHPGGYHREPPPDLPLGSGPDEAYLGGHRGEPRPYGSEAGSPYPGRHDREPYPWDGGRQWDPGEDGGRPAPTAQRHGSAPIQEKPVAAPPPPEPEWDPDAPVPLWRRPIVLGAALLALIGALFLGLWFAARNEKPPTHIALPTPTPLAPIGPGGKYGYAGSRATDKTPLAVRELFGRKKFTKRGRSYLMTVWRKEKSCADGISGAHIAKALRSGRCTQLIRASFADGKGTIIGTVGVANLTTSAAAKKVAFAGGGAARTDYLKPLPGTDEATRHLGAGEAYAGGWTHGHYAVLLWFQFRDGHKPSRSELKRLYQAAVDITDETVFPALEHRSLTGSRAADGPVSGRSTR